MFEAVTSNTTGVQINPTAHTVSVEYGCYGTIKKKLIFRIGTSALFFRIFPDVILGLKNWQKKGKEKTGMSTMQWLVFYPTRGEGKETKRDDNTKTGR